MPSAPRDGAPGGPVGLRRGVLAVSVLDDIPLEPRADGIALADTWDDPPPWTPVPWSRLAAALGGAAPESEVGRLRLRDWLRLRSRLAALGERAGQQVVALALPAGHALHPGAGWTHETVLGGVLELGLGLRTDVGGEDAVLALAPGAAECAGIDPSPWWPPARERLDAMAALAVDRLVRDGKGLLAPVGGCDVLTLLASSVLRRHLADGDGTGMRALAAPMRTRAWFDLARIDPAFVSAAAAATQPQDRGVPRPLLVTADEVALAGEPSDVAAMAAQALREPAADRVVRAVRYD